MTPTGRLMRTGWYRVAFRAAQIGAVALSPLLLLAGCTRESPVRDGAESAALVTHHRLGELSIEMRVGPTEPRVGDVIRVTLAAPQSDHAEVEFPSDVPGLARPPVVISAHERVYEFDAIESGEMVLPAMVLRSRPRFAEAVGPHSELRLEGPVLRIRSVLSETDAPDRPREIIGVRPAPLRPLTVGEWSLIAGGTVLAVSGLWLTALLIRRARRRPPAPLPPDVIALRALSALAPGGRWEESRLREAHGRIAAILREFLQRRFSIGAADMTTNELLAQAESRAAEHGFDAGVVRLILTACDAVKYAAGAPDPRATEELMSVLRAFVVSAGGAASPDRGSGGGAA
ncbi:MAG: hypothetical protein HRU75_02495 [Planctomycetia bacterium]|nr:MAG: hypothetical protein HRU75_02495 [Planctomycetia bacterium]